MTMTDPEARTAELLTRVASETHAPAHLIARLNSIAASLHGNAWSSRAIVAAPAVALGAAVVLVAAVVTSALAPAANAASILRSAERAAMSGTAALTSYSGTISGESWQGEDGKRAASASTFVQKISTVTPNKLRLDITGTAANRTTGHQLLVSDGATAWIYAPDAKTAQPIPPEFVMQQGPFAASTLAGAQQSFSQVFDVTQQADATVAGRAAYVLRLVPKAGTPMTQQIASVRLWIDQATLLQLGAELDDATGVLMRWHFDTIEVNVDIAADTFAFTPPAGTSVAQLIPPQAAQAMREQQWAMLASQVSFAVFRPLVTVDGLEEVGPGRSDDGLVMVGFRVPNGPVVAAVLQGAPSAFTAGTGGAAITIGDAQATYRVADGLQTIDFDRSGTHIRAQGPAQLPKEALLGVAASLAAVPKP
jgi:outer membrane lipoprotein-sorting protein